MLKIIQKLEGGQVPGRKEWIRDVKKMRVARKIERLKQ